MRNNVVSTLLGIIVLSGLSLLATGQAKACSRDFLVFYNEPGSTSISPRAAQIIEEFVSYFRIRSFPDPARSLGSCGLLPPGDWKVVVMAHADDPGIRDQCALSFARGHAVRARLAALGVPEASIAVEVFGDRSKRIQTPAGARDVQNRRVHLGIVEGENIVEGSSYPRMVNPPKGICPDYGLH